MSDTFVKDPNNIEPFFVIWAAKSGLNDASLADNGDLQGATISTSTWTVPAGITKDSDNKGAVTIRTVVYAINTAATIWLSGGTAGTDYELVNQIVTSDSRTLDKTIIIQVRET